jgi:hypothetical protein
VLQMYVTNRAVNEGLAFRGTDIPPASNPTSDNCHFDPLLSTNIGYAARDFIDGSPSPTPTPTATPTPSPTATPAPVPLAPTSLVVVAVSTSQINLSWTDNSADELGFSVERCTGTNCTGFVEIAQIAANTVQFSNVGLAKNTVYSYRVRAFNGAGNSAYSNISSVRTLKK